MSNTVIKVENLTKEYKILHEKKDPYVKFSDVLVEFSKKIVMPWKFFQTKDVEMFKALDDVNFEIKKGEKIAIIGRNGAGKSTLLKVLSRITEPTEGSVKIKGRVVSLLEVGTGFHPELTGRENIFLNGAILGMTKKEIQTKFDDIVEFSGCEKFLDTPVKRYSSGMRVRLGFAVAAHLESEILIVDEVLAVGDAEFQKKCLGKMDEISKGEGRTIIFVSHNMSAVQNLCDKGIVMDKGQIKFAGYITKSIKVYNEGSKGDTKEILKQHKDLNMLKFEKAQTISSGSSVNLSFEFDSKREFKDCFLDFSFINATGEHLVYYFSNEQGKNFDIRKGKIVIKYEVSELMLNSGTYDLLITLGDRANTHLYRVFFKNYITVINKNSGVSPKSTLSFKTKKEVIQE